MAITSTSIYFVVIFIQALFICCHGFVQPVSHHPSIIHNDRKISSFIERNWYRQSPYYCCDKYNYHYHGTKLQSSPMLTVPLLPKPIKTSLISALLLLVGIFNYRRILWPGSLPDPAVKEPLVPGELGCPFIGTAFNVYSMFKVKKNKDASRVLDFDKPRMKSIYAFFSPMVFISGGRIIKKILNSEFDSNGIEMASFFPNERKLLGGQSILYSKDKKEHNFLRRLVGNAMTPRSISKVIPQLQSTATKHIESMLHHTTGPLSNEIVGEDIAHEFTLDIASRIILGLNLPKEREQIVKRKINTLIEDFLTLTALLTPFYKRTEGWKARQYLVGLIEEKIHDLRESGPDGSTLSAMVFAIDDESNQSLSDEQIIDNVIFLLIAGSETSSSTLTNCLLLLGLHPKIWDKIVEEQCKLCDMHGDELTKDQLDKDCVYLEAVIKEAMRLRPISGGQYRRMTATMVVDGMQIPKGWPLIYNIRQTHELDPITRLKDGSHMDIIEGFKPERWLDETTRPKEGDYMPFGSGPRYCLGSTLAMAEMKVFLAVLARKVSFDLVGVDNDNIEWKKADLIAVPKDGVPMSVKPASTII